MRLLIAVRHVAYAALAVLLAVPSWADGPPATVDDYVVTSWTEPDGLWASYIRAFAQDREGYLWLGTENGLIRFDGVRFVWFQPRNGTQLPQRSVVNLCVGTDASLWVGFGIGGGLSQIRDDRVTNHDLYDGFVNGCVEDADGTLWVGTRGGLHRRAHGRWEKLGTDRGIAPGRIFDVHVDRTGAVWVASVSGIFRLERGSDAFESVNERMREVRTLVESADGAVWAAERHFVSRLIDGGRSATVLTVKHGNVSTILHDSRGNLWIGTFDHGLWLARRHGDGYTAPAPIGHRRVFSSEAVYALFEDREKNVWASTPLGIHKFSPRRLTPITDLGVVRAVEVEDDATAWVATADGLIRLSDRGRISFGSRDGLPSGNIRALHRDAAGVLWVATDAGVARRVNGRFHTIPGLPNSMQVASLASDGRGTLWIRDVNLGLLRWTPEDVRAYNPSPTLPHTSVDLVAADRSGRIWLAITGGGIGVVHPDRRFEIIRPADAEDPSTLAIYEDRGGSMWFGNGAMLSRLAEGAAEPAARISTGYAGDVILSIVDDANGDLWLGMSSGIVHLPRAEFQKAAADPTHRMRLRHYGSSDGAAGLPVRIAYPSVARRPDGRLLFVTASGLTLVDPRSLTAGPVPPVRIEQLAVDGRPFDVEGPRELPANTSSVHIDYTASTFISPDRIQFRYKLDGFDADWVDAGDRRQAFYTNLAPGEYRFEVSARSAEGVWTPTPAVLTFRVLPAFYQTYLFYGLCASVILLAVIGAWQYRLRQVRRDFSLVLAERVRLSREIHDTLLQSLVGVGIGLDVSASRLGPGVSSERDQLVRLRQQVTRYIRDARQRIWDLRSPALAHSDLSSAIRETAEQALAETSIGFEYAVSGTPSACGVELEQQLLSICQEAIANVVHHARATRIRVSLEYGRGGIGLTVADDGCGFDARAQAQRGGSHCGLLIMQERAEQIGGRFRIDTFPGGGTRVDVFVPVSLADGREVEVA